MRIPTEGSFCYAGTQMQLLYDACKRVKRTVNEELIIFRARTWL